MKKNPVISRRTFEAAKFPKGSAERALLNGMTETSEYMRSYRYCVRYDNYMNDGTVNPVQPTIADAYTTRAEAEAAAARSKP